MRKVLSLACIIFCIVFFACNNNEQQKEANAVKDDSLQTVKSITSEDSEIIYKSRTDNWLSSSVKKDNVDWSHFHLEEFWSDDSLKQETFTPDNNFYKDYVQLLRWSPDSNYVLDLGTYGAVKTKDKNGKTKIESGEVDTEVALLDLRSKTRYRLMFFGPSTAIVDGRWLDSSNMAILGLNEQNSNQHPDTVLWVINAKDKFFRKYRWE
jgi:uncharacterized protein YcfL